LQFRRWAESDTTVTKSEVAKKLDELQSKLRPSLKDLGFRARGRTFNRTTGDGLTQVVQFQMGRFDPPGTTFFPGLRENLYGKFTVNLGVYVPEVAQFLGGGEAHSFVQEPYCCVRARLGELGPEHEDRWWELQQSDEVTAELWERLKRDGFPFLGRFETRDAILMEWLHIANSPYADNPARIVCAIILVKRGQQADARALLAAQARETRNPGHPAYVRSLADRLGVGELDA
jgi:hypothetical protein